LFEKTGKPQSETSGISNEFSEAFKHDGGFGKEFADGFKRDGHFGKELADTFKNDIGLTDIARGFSRPETPPLTDEQKEKIKKETGWPPEIIDSIATMEEYEIYKKAGLVAVEINGKWCLIRNDIDWEQKDEFGRTNKERTEQGLAPLDKNGKPIELHHIGQKPDSPLAELTQDEHRGKGNDSVLHDKNKDTEIDRGEFQKEKEEHWKARANEAQQE
jgi:hypothetical protein